MKRTGRSIDAAYLGNESRFINGTVDANCMTQIGMSDLARQPD